MCCMGERCFRVNCACICVRCRDCDDCARVFGRGGMALKLAHTQLGRLAAGVVRSGAPRPPPSAPSGQQPPADPWAYTTPAYTTRDFSSQQPQPSKGPGEGTQLKNQAGEHCVLQ